VSRQETIGADPSVVWAFGIDVERWPQVIDHIDRIERCDHVSSAWEVLRP